MISKGGLFGLVLSGGKSSRMGRDKGLIAYHGMPQREYLYRVMDTLCDRTYLSIRVDQQEEIDPDYGTILDTNAFYGPYNGLLSAHKAHPNVAWLVVACDMPFVDKETLQELISQRDPSKMATCFANAPHALPEPLCAIWEPKALADSVLYLKAERKAGPRKFLMDADVTLVVPNRAEVLLNANSKLDYEEALLKLNR
ncbi:NTP transferase domain-containing protein [Maribacter chungangensis]|uniref:Probable molybdenum cofactor guanylyltransferase n=1 Tax=Maribacter chungangensis TaxID=1069117 RepID=A0ABW3B5J7_9FLAO